MYVLSIYNHVKIKISITGFPMLQLLKIPSDLSHRLVTTWQLEFESFSVLRPTGEDHF